MLLHLHFYLLLAKGQGWEIVKYLPCVCASVCAFVTFLHKHLYLISIMISSSPNLLWKIFMAVETCLSKILSSFKKKTIWPP